MELLNEKIINRQRRAKIQDLRDELPPRIGYGDILRERLENQGYRFSKDVIYSMVRGNRNVNPIVLDEMEKLVEEYREMLETVHV